VANRDSDNISILLSDGDGTYASPVNYDAGDGPKSVTSGDLDGDGDLDLAVANYLSNNISIFLGIGNGTFAPAVDYIAGERPSSVTSSDLDGDGDLDLAVANTVSDNVSVFLGNGDGTFAPAVDYITGDGSISVISSDFNGDGDLDLAVANYRMDNVSILLGNGDGTFANAVNYYAGNEVWSITSSDLDGDGNQDLAAANRFSDNVSIRLGNGDGTFAPMGTPLHAGDGPTSIISRDLDGDGDSDLAVANCDSDDVSIFLGNGDGTFAAPENYSAGEYPTSVTCGDLDGDGDYDLAVTNAYPDNVSIYMNLSNRPPLPLISSISDIPNDQGKQARITWDRCGPDGPGASITVTEYVIYRKIDYNLSAPSGSSDKGEPDEFDKMENDRGLLLYPSGYWEYVKSVPACAEAEYSVVAPTLADSTISEGMYYSSFFIRALTHTPGVYFDAAPDSGYSVDNLAPGVPEGFSLAYNTGSGNELAWEESEDVDFKYFRIYRSENGEFEPGPGNLVHSTADAQWRDTVDKGWKYNYMITALDHSGNESDPKAPDVVTGVEMPDVPGAFVLHQNCPNPFNPVTTIRFDLPASAEVTLSIYNVKGEKVRVLLNRRMTAGRKSVDWNGRSDRGRAVASGVYFYHFSAGEFKETRKMILLK